MHPPTHLNTATLPIPKLIGRSPWRRGFPVILLALALGLFALSPSVRAVNPPPDGGYPNQNTAEGDNALFNLTTGPNNTAVGFEALFSNTFGQDNTAVGADALHRGMRGSYNTAVGARALFSNDIGAVGGNWNTATGADALHFNAGTGNTATGAHALFNNSGSSNTATGMSALSTSNGGSRNTATGASALQVNSASDNTATGFYALLQNTTGHSNTANGDSALLHNATGYQNTAIGFRALLSNSTGRNNSTMGDAALLKNTTGSGNTAAGAFSLQNNTTGSSNIAIGINAGNNLTTGSDNIDIGAFGVAGEAGTIRIGAEKQGATYIAGIYGTTVPFGVGVVVSPNGKLGMVTSSARFKEAIRPMDQASKTILALKPVTFRYKHELDPDGIPQFGLVAEQVEKVNPDLVVHGEEGKVMTVRYDAVNAMLLNEFLKEHGKVEEQQAAIAQLKATAAQQQKQIEALTATVQKVNERVELSAPAPRIAVNED